jgi:uncharacterized membrane protein
LGAGAGPVPPLPARKLQGKEGVGVSLLIIVRVIAILTCGLSTGILFGDRMGATFARPSLSPPEFIRYNKIVHSYFGRMMPVLTLTGVATGLIWLIVLRVLWSSLQFGLVAAATIAMAIAVGLTVTINVPINKQLEKWSETSPPGNMREIWSRWEQIHTIRTILWMGAFVLEAVALGVFGSA